MTQKNFGREEEKTIINQERLWQRLMQLGEIGKQPAGGVTRLAFTAEERAAKQLVASFMQEAGLEVREDAVGNLIGRKAGKQADAPVILVGSHLDSVYHGGNFDGPLGVLGGIEALQTMNEQAIATEHPIEVVAFTDEEGMRFRYGMIGSRGLAGTLEPDELKHRDEQGISIAQAMREAGFDPARIKEAARPPGSVLAYLELHIEQGKVLESQQLPVGVVTGIAGPLWLHFTIEGEAGHAGATPMNLRRDALAAASAVMLAMEQEAAQTKSSVATVGQLQLTPGGINIIPGKVEFTLDLRDIDAAVRDQVEQRIIQRAQEICEQRGVNMQVRDLQRIPPVICAPDLQELLGRACVSVGLADYRLPSGAGHDAMQLAQLCPIGMVFVRSRDGISHHPAEWSSPEDCALGVEVLYRALLQLAR